MPGDPLQRHRRARRIAVGRAARRGDRDLALHGHAVQRELPADQAGERVQRGLRARDLRVGAEHRDPGRDAVVALRLGADDGRVDAAGAALEDLAVLVDEEVVAEVVPAVGVAVVAGDPEHDPRRVLGVVGVGRHRVVHERDLDRAVVGGRARRDGVAAPLGPGDHAHRRALDLAAGGDARAPAQALADPAGDGRGRQGAHEAGAQRARVAAQAQLELVGGADERRVGAGDGARAVGPVVAHDVQRRPRGPAAAAPARAHLRLGVAAARPAQADQVEAARRAQHPRRAPARAGDRGGQILAGEVELEQRAPAGEGGGGRLQGDGGKGGGAEPEDLAARGTTIRHGLSEHHMDRKGPVNTGPGGQVSLAGERPGDGTRASVTCSQDRNRAARRRGRRRRSRAAPRGRG